MTERSDTIRVLHLDDEQTVLTATENYFRRFEDDIGVETTTDPAAALARLDTGEFDCLLSDYEMPQMDGLTVLERVQADGLGVPVVMYTGRGSEDVASEAISKGAADYVPKGGGIDHYASLAEDIRTAVTDYHADESTTTAAGDPPTESESEGETTAPRERIAGLLGVDTAGRITHVDEQAATLLDTSRDTLLEASLADALPTTMADRLSAQTRRAMAAGKPVGFELPRSSLRGVIHPGDDGATVQLAVEPTETASENGVDGEVITVPADRNALSRPERDASPSVDELGERLQELYRQTRTLPAVESMAELQTEALAAAETVLDMAVTAIWRYDEDDGALVPVAATAATDSLVDWTPVTEDSETLLWQCYESGQVTWTDSVADAATGLGGQPLDSAVIAPLGEYGVFVGATTDPDAFDTTDADLFGALASSVESTIESLSRQREQREQQAFTDSLIDAIPDVFYAFDEDGQYYRWNDRLLEATGYDETELAERRPWELIPAHDSDRVAAVIDDIVQTGETDRVESWLLTSEGREIPYEYTWAPIRDADGDVVGVAGIGRDITERKAREERLEATKQRLDLALEATDTGVWEWDTETDEVFWNESTHHLFGVDPGEFEETFEAFTAFVHPDDLPAVEDALDRALEHGERYDPEFRIRDGNGETIWMYARAELVTDDDGTERMVGTITDITERKRREQQLEENQEKLQQISENLDDVVWMNTPDQDGIQFITAAYEDIWDRSVAELEENPETFVDGIHPDDRDGVITAMAAQQDDPDGYDETYRVVRPDGEVRWVHDRSSGVYDEAGDLERIVGIASDITQRKQREQQLEETRQQLDLALDETNTGVWVLDSENGTLIPYGKTAELHGLESGVTDGQVYLENIHPDDREHIVSVFGQTTGPDTEVDAEFRIVVDGSVRWLRSKGKAIPDSSRIIGVTTDITERKERERELQRNRDLLEQTQELADVGGWEADLETQAATWTDQMHRILGVPDDREPETLDDAFEYVHPDDQTETRDAIDRITQGEEVEFEIRVRTDAGETRLIRSVGEPVYEDGDVVRIRGAMQDITDQKAREQELEETRQQLDLALEETNTGIWLLDTEAGTVTPYGKTADIFGVDADERVQERYLDNIHPDDRARAESDIEEAIDTQSDYDSEFRVVVDGTERWLRGRGKVVTDVSGVGVEMLGVTTDITERREREQAIAESEARFRSMAEALDTSSIGTFILDDEFSVVWTNEAIEEYFGVDSDAIAGADKATLIEDELRHIVEDGERFTDRVTATYEDNIGVEEFECHVLPGEDRDERWLLHRSVPIEQGQYAGGRVEHYTDITDRKAREQELQTVRQRFEQFAGNVQDAFFLLPTDYSEVEYVNPAVESIYGITPAKAYEDPMAWLEHVHPEDEDDLLIDIGEQTRGAAEWPIEQEFRVQHPDRGLRWVQARLDVATDDDGNPSRFTGVSTDITDRKQREQELEGTRRQRNIALEETDTGVWLFEPETNDVTPHGNITDLFGLDHGETDGEAYLRAIHPDDREAVIATIRRVARNRGRYDTEFRVVVDGDTRWLKSRGKAVVDGPEATPSMIGVTTDITERKEREQELERQNERLELLASTISHDLRNPLRSAQTNLKMAQHETESDLLDDIEFAHERMKELISDLLTLARQGQAVSRTERVDLATVAEEAWDGVETAEATLTTDSVTVPADRSRLLQVFENLFVNATTHGRADVQVRVGPTDRGFFVEDDGPGVPADERRYVFEYGYSNAETGTGFGLAIVREIAEAHGWSVSLTESESGGARFEFET